MYHRSFKGATMSKPAAASFSLASAVTVFHALLRPAPPALRIRLMNRRHATATATPTAPATAAFGGPVSSTLTTGSGFFILTEMNSPSRGRARMCGECERCDCDSADVGRSERDRWRTKDDRLVLYWLQIPR